jgi:hypothetical protein
MSIARNLEMALDLIKSGHLFAANGYLQEASAELQILLDAILNEQIAKREETRRAHAETVKALADAGYMPVSEYVENYR